jgi:hypothetical protein
MRPSRASKNKPRRAPRLKGTTAQRFVRVALRRIGRALGQLAGQARPQDAYFRLEIILDHDSREGTGVMVLTLLSCRAPEGEALEQRVLEIPPRRIDDLRKALEALLPKGPERVQ